MNKLSNIPWWAKAALVLALIYFGYQQFFGLKQITTLGDYKLQYLERTFGPQSNSPRPMILLIHGTGADEEDLLFLFETIDFPIRVISFRGPFPMGLGYDWGRGTGASQTEARENYNQIFRQVAEDIALSVDQLMDRYPTQGLPMVLGFSTGARITNFLSAHYMNTFSAYFSLSGDLPADLMPERIYKTEQYFPVFMYHGKNDQQISFKHGQKAADQLRKLNPYIYFIEFDSGHLIPSEIKTDLLARIQEHITRL